MAQSCAPAQPGDEGGFWWHSFQRTWIVLEKGRDAAFFIVYRQDILCEDCYPRALRQPSCFSHLIKVLVV